MTCPHDDSRRLTGPNPYFDGCGAALEVIGEAADPVIIEGWREGVERMAAALDWPPPQPLVRRHASGASLAFHAPLDQLYTATEVNEWALLAALPEAERAPWLLQAPGDAAAWDEDSARHTVLAAGNAEHQLGLPELAQAAAAHRLNILIDEDAVTLGSGAHSRSWPPDALPRVSEVDWPGIGDVPIALVTGSNGKTTTVRLLAAFLRAHGWRTAHSCTDGVFVDGALVEAGDYSGPGGARAALRQNGVEAAVLETARGGILRRGLGVQHANVALVTNISDDHFGEYGIHDLDALAEVKLTVARALGDAGLLIANADDALLACHARARGKRMAWFGLDDARPELVAARERGEATCAPHDGHLRLVFDGAEHGLGVIADMPLSASGHAHYNIANLAAAALAAAAFGIDAPTIAGVLARFGAEHADNPGRLQQWSRDGIRVLLDYAHNPGGLRALLGVIEPLRGNGRLGLLLGHAGNREDDNLRELAAVAAAFRPDRVLLKEIAGYERGRAPGEVAAILRAALADLGIGADRVAEIPDETQAAEHLLAWAQPGDILVMPILTPAARAAVTALLDAWQTAA